MIIAFLCEVEDRLIIDLIIISDYWFEIGRSVFVYKLSMLI